ncbi:hypothetical protein COW36_05215 [bacterium (Candidatus Blackallbacteria) CG17_big_fil_post_rev_8_21_14_2_50_48_46]|uniref:Flagellar assembly protein FliH/Type III secretion system HrpE domain-containing protein n=1 Tax=bacterium (Candidatus Blackallbacteria) CG17_big_fil_post_rev_8_21_14_2_50_48_46 TaxID=2014261 RepID=A0A2M7G9A8_9BACT|nr:MAG: hypothetical protein COW64_03730 [bacterium (Candidatus Blackallbacteria) CG18_big_fil_WC_8_21_14_2_50_49_26]PIW18696.1 MAG: hypothetical protein COW36_05215 [bacterium (Candidatus Blackallbacteria) CG17_big_fil_post_rev_8_21_14_2_50_48_46]PIW46318.1 MAG: hypothetical protein COW20_15465 [bacterium (Candidatus Blackallbacteria) CG13_big_fil_rev_8_21_14_2_50_49_14]
MSSDSFFHPRILKNVQLESERCIVPSSENSETLIANAGMAAALKAEAILKQANAQAEKTLEEARQEAAALLQQARQDASALLQEADTKLRHIEAQAYQEGLARGEETGQAKLLEALQAFQSVLLAAQNERQRLLLGTEAETVHLILDIVRKILKIEPIINEQVIVRVVRAALQRLGQSVNTHIHVNPADLELLHFSLSQLQDLALEIVLEPDEKIAPGGCLIRSKAGTIDATIDSQLETVVRSFLAVAEG